MDDETYDFSIDDSEYAANYGDSSGPIDLSDANFIYDGFGSVDEFGNANYAQQPPSWDPNFGLQSLDFGSTDFGNGGVSGLGGMTLAPQDWGSTPIQLSPEEMQAAGNIPSTTNWNPNSTQVQQPGSWSNGGIGNFLAQLFAQRKGGGSTAGSLAKLIGSGVTAAAAGKQNQQLAQQIPQAVQQSRQAQSPFDYGAQPNGPRAAAQAEYLKALQNPYGSKIVSDQVDALAKAQAIKDAAAGRRSNNATSSPALITAQAQIAQKYLNDMATQSGAGFNPSGSGLDQLVQAIRAGSEGYVSPLSRAAGYALGSNSNQNSMGDTADVLSQLIAAMQQKGQ